MLFPISYEVKFNKKNMTLRVVLGLLSVALGATMPKGIPTEHLEEYIVGGKPTEIEEVPYQVALLSRKEEFICGGSILSDTYILTAAHCIDLIYPNYQEYKIRAESSNKTKGGQLIKSKKVVVHSKYNSVTMDFDIAIIELASPIKLTKGSKPIKIADKEPADGELVKVSGWGCLKENGTRPFKLHSVTVATVSRKTCAENYKNHYNITKRMICAAGTQKDACQGDSGGPLAYKNTLVGVVSFGVGCAREKYPGVYVNIADYEIRKFLRENAHV